MKKTILVVDDDPVQRRLLCAAIERMGHDAQPLEDGEKALAWLDARPGTASAMVLDLVMPGIDGLTVMREMAGRGIAMPVIVQTAKGGIDVAVSAMRAGAFDFCVKPASPERLQKALGDALKVEEQQDSLKAQKPERRTRRSGVPTLIGQSPAMERVQKLIQKAAASDIPVLIEGESGTGKELVARSIQAESPRANKPFVTVNCGAIPENLVESILFGHEKGAFTGATERHVGKFVEADGGTLFLDEIGDLPLEAQVKLLRAIQEGEVEPVGARTSRRVNVRLISATHRDLIAAVREGTFREDLYYRLNVFPVMVPPLRYRREDIPDLARHFIKSFAESNAVTATGLAPDAVDLMVRHDWPGNIRQLQNAIFRAVVLSDEAELTAGHFPQISAQVDGISIPGDPGDGDETDMHTPGMTTPEPSYPAQSLHHPAAAVSAAQMDDFLRFLDDDGHARALSEIEGDVIARAIDRYNGRMSEVARRLGIGRSTLYRKLKEYDIEHSAVS